MTRRQSIKVGDKFIAKPNVEIEVVEYIDHDNVKVVDSLGNSKTVSAAHLRRGSIQWRTVNGALRRGVTPSDGEPVIVTKKEKLSQVFSSGSVWHSRKCGDFEIVEVKSSVDVTVRWLEDGSIETGVTLDNIRKGSISRTTKPRPMKPDGNYVYTVTIRGEVVYVGRGINLRYLHCFSGRSGNRELNRMYFAKEPMFVEVIVDGLSKPEAMQFEAEMIRRLKPKCNFALCEG